MELSEVTIFMKTLSALLRQKDWMRVAEHYQFPLPFYHQDDIVLMQNPSEFLQALSLRNLFLRDEGIERLEPLVLKIEERSERRCLMVVQWDHITVDNIIKFQSKVRYVIAYGQQIGDFKIELVEYLVPVFTAFAEQFSRARDVQPPDPFEFLPRPNP